MSQITTVSIGGRQVLVKREDLLHPFVSGNKFRKLKYNLLRALEIGASEIISFGGAFSNHIHALAFACKSYHIPLVLFIRGEDVDNPTLSYIRSTGARLNFVSRTEYRELKKAQHFEEYPNAFVVPEGGSNKLALRGLSEMMEELYDQLSEINGESIHAHGYQLCVSYGSGGTSIGMMSSKREVDELHIFSSLKMRDLKNDFLSRCQKLNVKPSYHYILHDNYHFGGFAKWQSELLDFMNAFEIPTDPLYTGKMFFGINELIKKGVFDERPIIAIHTGGIQGVAGFNQRFGPLLKV